jgi:uncharacterized protein DUF6152
MMRSKRTVLVAGMSLLLAPPPGFAHHGLDAQFDPNQRVTLTGTVTKVDWSSPHARFYIDVRDEGNTVTNWELDMGSPNAQMLKSWKIDTLRRGDHVTVNAYRARDGSSVGYARKVKATSH